MKASNESNPKNQDPVPTEHLEQPETFTPGITRAMVRQHAYELYRDKLAREALTLQDWVLAEKDLVHAMETDNVPK